MKGRLRLESLPIVGRCLGDDRTRELARHPKAQLKHQRLYVLQVSGPEDLDGNGVICKEVVACERQLQVRFGGFYRPPLRERVEQRRRHMHIEHGWERAANSSE